MTLEHTCSTCDPVTRRDFLSSAARGMLGVGSLPWLAQLATAQEGGTIPLLPATARNVIYLYMSGGMSHLDTFDLKPGTDVQGPTEAIATKLEGFQLSKHFANLAQRMDQVCVINSMFSNQGAHAQGRYFMHTGYLLRGTIRHPTLGAWLTRMAGVLNPMLPGHVEIGGGAYTASAGFFEGQFGPLPIGDPADGLKNSHRPQNVSEARFARRLKRLHAVNAAFSSRYNTKKVRAYGKMYEQAVSLMNSKETEAFDISQEPEALRAAYGDNPFGQGCLLARRLVEHKVRFIEVVNGGWDTHNDNFERMADKLPIIDRALSALLSDLEVRGLLDDTLVVLTTEFGRSPRIRTDRNNGRDHHPKAFSTLLAGGGVRGGQVHGKTDKNGSDVIDDKVTVPDFNATIAHALGLPLDHKLYSPSGRPFTVADKGKPVLKLFA